MKVLRTAKLIKEGITIKLVKLPTRYFKDSNIAWPSEYAWFNVDVKLFVNFRYIEQAINYLSAFYGKENIKSSCFIPEIDQVERYHMSKYYPELAICNRSN